MRTGRVIIDIDATGSQCYVEIALEPELMPHETVFEACVTLMYNIAVQYPDGYEKALEDLNKVVMTRRTVPKRGVSHD